LKQLVAYITSKYPDSAFSVDLARTMGENGVDSIELGIPFSDPVADGPVIEKANYLALERGFKMADLFDISKQITPHVDTLWMGYFNPFYQYGMNALLDKAAEFGVSGLIIPDLPHEESTVYASDFERRGIANIAFVAPTDSDARIETVVKDAKKFIYLVAYAGITGAGKSEDLGATVASIKRYSATPVYVGFGVNEKTAKEKAQGVDGVIVGSAFINILLQDDLSPSQKISRCAELSRIIKSQINE